MDFKAVLGILNDLPPTFKRPNPPYIQLMDSQASALAFWTLGTDGLVQQVSFASAVDGWLDCWGLLMGIRRVANEGNGPYATRLNETVLAWVGTLPAIQRWLNLFAPGGTVVENASGLGYAITLPAGMTAIQIAAFLSGLNRIRPAGVPFTLQQQADGLYLGTDVFYGGGMVAGSYLVSGAIPVNSFLGAVTDSAQPLLPTLLLTDPTINPI